MASILRPISGRVHEIQTLTRVAQSRESEFVVVYGRRRVGKTFLVRRFFQDQDVAYFEMVGQFDGTRADHLAIFSRALARTFYRGADVTPPPTWRSAFDMLAQAVESGKGNGKKHVLFFDELPWISTHRSGFLGALEHFWNAWCSRRRDIVLVVCGSAASWMLQKIVNARGGLHNRLTQQIRLLPLTLAEAKQYMLDRNLRLTDRELIELYMVLGGVPHYLDRLVRGQSVAQQVDGICLHKDAPLRREFDRLFASLFDADQDYVRVVRALAKKRRGLSRAELLDTTGLATGGGATTILNNLEEGGFIGQVIPFGKRTRDRLYRLDDEFCLFHLKWLDARRPKSWQLVRKTPAWRAWAGLAFEALCHRHVKWIEKSLGISGVATQHSGWQDPAAQIDLVIDRADDVISICEMKFTDEAFAITKKYAAELRQKIAVFRAQTATRKRTDLVFVTSYGIVPNHHAQDLVDHVVTMEEFLS